MPDKFVLKIEEVIQETPDTKTFRLRPEKEIDFKAGQFLMLSMEIDGKKVDRPYSISSSPTDELPEITFKLNEKGTFTPRLYKLEKGDSIEAKGPYGVFLLDENADRITFLSGGVGITPFRSMWRYVIAKKLPAEMTLLYCARTPEDIVYRKELQSMDSRMKVVITITRPETSSEKWEGPTGRLCGPFLQKNVEDPEKSVYYLCGPEGMVHDMEACLKEIGISPKMIRKEKW